MRTVAPISRVTPGEMLDEECLKPQRIGDIVAGKRAITADTDLRLCRYFGLNDGWWLRGQANCDMALTRESMGEALARIGRCALLSA